MKTLSKKEFLKRMKPLGVVAPEKYPETLMLEGAGDFRCAWIVPQELKALHPFISPLIDATEPKGTIYLFPRAGAWRSAGTTFIQYLYDIIFAAAACSPDADVVLETVEKDRDAVDALAMYSLMFGGCVDNDIMLVSDTCGVILYMSHHDTVFGQFRDETAMKTYLGKTYSLEQYRRKNIPGAAEV